MHKICKQKDPFVAPLPATTDGFQPTMYFKSNTLYPLVLFIKYKLAHFYSHNSP